MTRRLPGGALLIAALALPWLAAVTLHVDLALQGRLAWAPLYVTPAESSGAYPRVDSFWSETPPDATDLQPGDLLLRVGDRDLAGALRLDVLAAVFTAAAESGVARFEVERAGQRRTARLALRAYQAPWSFTPLILSLGAAAFAIAARGPRSRSERAFAHTLLAYSFHWAAFLSGGGWRTHLGLAVYVGAIAVTGPLGLRAMLLFGRAGEARSEPWWPWAFLAIGPLLLSWQVGSPLSPDYALPILLSSYALVVACLNGVMVRTYRRADAREQRQLRWVLYGVTVSLTPVAAVALLGVWRPAWRPAYEWSLLCLPALPLCCAIALIRYNLFDIDRLISSTVSYSLIGVVFTALLFGAAPRAAEAASAAIDLQPAVVQALLALALAAALVFGGQVIRPYLEGFFFRERRDLDEGVRVLRTEVRRFDAPGPLLEHVGTRLAALLRLQSCAIYARSGERFAPNFASAPLVPPGFDVRGRLLALLGAAEQPVGMAEWRRWHARELIDPVENAQLEALDARLLLPIRRDKRLEAFLCLGEKGSADVYTPVDVALLEGLAETLSLRLERFDAAALERSERERYERLAGYVPAAIRDELARRASEVEPGEREVSLLFVDLRGYTGFSEGRSPEEIFEVVSAYTTAASEMVRDHGGWVVDFQGDGLMAVFGAPRELPDKERAAVSAALDLARNLSLEAVAGVELGLGVGVATGPAYVGNLQSVDRRIWCVLGNTTNLAARLQSLTRELGAQVVIDDTTRLRAGDAATDFVPREQCRVRGRSEPMTLHLAA